MKLSVNWLRDYLDFDCSPADLAERLTMAGLEVEESVSLGRDELCARGGVGESDDIVWDVKVTPNRGDWLSVIGVAREAAPLVGRRMRMPAPSGDGVGPPASDLVRIDIDRPDLCGRYVGVVVRGVTVGESPGWMKDRLIAAGMRPINNVVDITNYVMLELGQPLHAFDYSLLRGSRIIVRCARAGETITSIDGQQRVLDPEMLVIADAERAVAIAGVMGGVDSEVSAHTQDILIESANFNNVSVRRTSKRLGMVTESSYRFERGVDPSITAVAALRAAELMRDLAAGEVAAGLVDANPRPAGPMMVSARPERVNTVLGTEIAAEDMAGYLNGLELPTTVRDGVLVCRVPTFRPDITREIDLVEEVGRAYGYDKLDETLPETPLAGRDSPEGEFASRVRRALMACGAQEVLTHSLVDDELARIAGRAERCVRVRNPLSEDLDAMRVMLSPNLLGVIARNQAFSAEDVWVFEVGKVYFLTEEGDVDERLAVAGAMAGSLWHRGWGLSADALAADFYLCKGAVESLLEGLGIEDARFEKVSDPLLHPGRAAMVMCGSRELGILGEAAPQVRDSLDIRGRPYVFELDFAALMESSPKAYGYCPLPRYPALYRHLAVVVDHSVPYERLAGVVRSSGAGMVESVDLLDVYQGDQIGAGRSSLTLSMVFRSPNRTLTDEEVNEVLAGIRDALQRELRASFR